MPWQENPPSIPDEGSKSKYYWYLDPLEKEPYVMEVWPNRYLKHLKGLWWSEEIPMPILPRKSKKTKKSNKID